MWTRRFVRSLKYDTRPRTTVPIEQFNSVVAVTFDTIHGAESHYANCTECIVMDRGGRAMTTQHPCRQTPKDS